MEEEAKPLVLVEEDAVGVFFSTACEGLLMEAAAAAMARGATEEVCSARRVLLLADGRPPTVGE